MKIREIITNPPRDEYIDQYESELAAADIVAKIRNLVLRKKVNTDTVEYGLFTLDKNQFVGYLSLDRYNNSMWMVTLVQLAQAYKNQGFGTFLYDYAVMDDKLTLISDATNTGGKNGSRELWLRLRDNNRYQVIGFDTKLNITVPNATPEQVYNNKDSIRWIAIPPSETINEALTRIKSVMSKSKNVVWYGPGTTTETYFNF